MFGRPITFGPSPKVILVRCWKRNEADMREFIARWEAFRTIFPFEKLLLVIDGDKDTDAMTQKSIDACGCPEWMKRLIVTGPESEKNWTRMLNAGLKFLAHCGVQDGLLLCASFEAVLDGGEDVLSSLHTGFPIPAIGVRLSQPEQCTPAVREFLNAQDHLQAINQVLRAEEKWFGSKQELALDEWLETTLYFCRNTFQVWSIADLLEIGGFDPRCNGFGGQEDTAARVRMHLRRGILTPASRIFHYRDKRVEVGAVTHLGESQVEKILREVNAAKQIYSLYHREYHAWNMIGSFALPTEIMDFNW